MTRYVSTMKVAHWDNHGDVTAPRPQCSKGEEDRWTLVFVNTTILDKTATYIIYTWRRTDHG